MNILITGISGFAGSHLAHHILNLLDPAIELYGTYLHRGELQKNLAPIAHRIKSFYCDITQPSELEKVLQEVKPEAIFHLAGMAYGPQADLEPAVAYQVNAFSVHHLLEGVLKTCPGAKVILISTSQVYGRVSPKDVPLREGHPLNPNNVYGASKAAMEMIARYYINRGLSGIILRPFNHIGPRQSDQFVVSNFCRQIARIHLGLQNPVLEVGDLESRRDFTDVRDMVRGYWIAARRGRIGEAYHLCSGKAYSIGQILQTLLKLTDRAVEIREDPKRLRKNDLLILLGSYQKFKLETGWEPQYNLESTLRETLNDWIAIEEGLMKTNALEGKKADAVDG